MKKTLCALFFLVLTAVPVFAETPESITKVYFDLLKNQTWDQIVPLYDRESLHEFREMMSFILELPTEVEAQALPQFFGPETTRESIKAMDDGVFFSSFLKSVMAQAAQLGQFDFKKIEVLGSVPEGTSLSHVVTRTEVSVGDISMESMEVISFKKTETGWKILLQGKMKGIAQQIKNAMKQR